MITQKLLKNLRPDLIYRSNAPWHPLNTPQIKNSHISLKSSGTAIKPIYCESVLKIVGESSRSKFTPHAPTTASKKDQTLVYYLNLNERATRSFLNIYSLTFTTNPVTINCLAKCQESKVMISAKNFFLFFPKAFYNTPLGSLDPTNLKVLIQITNSGPLLSTVLPLQNTKKSNSFRNILRAVEQSA